MILVQTKNLTKHFGPVHAVDDISFSIRERETLGLVGESGCGKSTTARMILRLIEPTAGEISFDGQNILKLKKKPLRKLRKEMQIVFQDPYASLNPRMTIGSTIAEPLRVHKINMGRGSQSLRVQELLDMVGLRKDFVNRYPHELSGGERQRVGIARALASNPKFIVADEPVSSLDVSIQAQVLNLLMDLKEQLGLTYLFIAHDLAVVRFMCDRIAVMHLGKIVELADNDELYNNPLHPYTQGLLKSTPVPDPTIKILCPPLPALGGPLPRLRSGPLRGEIPSPIDPPSGCTFHTRCPRVEERCRNEEPPLEDRGGGHLAACWLVYVNLH